MDITKSNSKLNSIVFIGNYLPRQCGIATFTKDLLTTVQSEGRNIQCTTVAMNDTSEGYRYPPEVCFEINQNKLTDYKCASDFLNINQVDIVSLQHEYGIFGGAAGSYIIELLRDLRMPIVTTLHTVLKNPNMEQEEVLQQLIYLSDRLVVMSQKAKAFLTDIHNAPKSKIMIVPHGIPDVPFMDPNYFKDQFGVEGKKVILTFGLLSPNKGIEYMLEAMPYILKRHPDVVYIVLGATHPHVKKTDGESYRLSLQKITRDLGISGNVIFQNRFVTIDELCEFLCTADIYVTPYLNEEQIASGTLAYALGTGNAIISTPYWYAEEMLSDGRGILVPFKDADVLAHIVNTLLEDEVTRHSMRKKGYIFSRSAIWKEVARNYLAIFSEVKRERARKPHIVFYLKERINTEGTGFEIPDIKLDHMLNLTDDTGIFQHAVFTVPDRRHGYCTDDNARALMVTALSKSYLLNEYKFISNLCARYLSFLDYAFNEQTNRFRNFMNYNRTWLEKNGSEDSHGRSLLGLGTTIANINDAGILGLSLRLFKKALPSVEKINSIRAIAYSLLGINYYLKRFSGDSEVRRIRSALAEKLINSFNNHDNPEWLWCEEILAYGNASIPQSLILSGCEMDDYKMIDKGLEILEWLYNLQHLDNHFVPIGNNGWYKKNSAPARFDQQPIEAQTMIDACVEAYIATGSTVWIDRTQTCFNWFLGNNDLGISLYNPRTGGCRDGLMPDGINENEGAESTLAWLLSLIVMHKLNADNILRNISERNENNIKLISPQQAAGNLHQEIKH